MPTVLKFVMRLALLPAILGLAIGVAQAQTGIPMGTLPRIVNFKPGSYQLADGSWHLGQLFLETTGQLRVRQPESKVSTNYSPGEISAFVLEADTFGVVRGINITARRRLSAVFAEQLYHYGRITAFKLDYRFVGAGESLFGNIATVAPGGADLVLQPIEGDAVIVPTSRGKFTEVMTPLFGDCPELADQIRKGKVGRQHTRQILQTYARWQQAVVPPVNP